ncbi:WD repeat-containing protein CG11141 [Eumeta japonica]|uniref:WD repeat-containing protein CG11141 n=1 Tax=Eumeta variegata TaxID=151549 RepID=A0A4C1WK66_EUMVA|nr:WD repeat-containing protein CG11141 [Eumeta japonica]
MSYWQSNLLVSSVYRTILCEKSSGDATWKVNQVGKKERKSHWSDDPKSPIALELDSYSKENLLTKTRVLSSGGQGTKPSLCRLGAVWQHSYARGGAAEAYCARSGLRLWRADTTGNVHQTLLFKEAINNPLTVAELLNPAQKPRPRAVQERNFGPLFVFREHFVVTHDDELLYVLDPRSLVAVAVVDDLRSGGARRRRRRRPPTASRLKGPRKQKRILSVSVNSDEILVLEGPRSVVRLAHAPDAAPAGASFKAR